MRFSSIILAAILVSVGFSGVFADDLYPPLWRGDPGSTFQMWEFLTPDPNAVPDVWDNIYGMPIAEVTPGTGQEWWDIYGDRQGVWPLSGTIEVPINNQPLPLPYKDILVQLTWSQQVSTSIPVVWDLVSGVQGTLVNEIDLGPTGEPYGDGTWYHSTYLIHLEPNPDFEIVKIDGTIMVDELVIDTICFPEPASLGLLALGGLAMLRRRR